MQKNILIVLAVFGVALAAVILDGTITGNSFATPTGYNIPRSCMDSDGNDHYVLGSGEYKGLSSNKMIPFADTCTNAGNLLEHYCDGAVHLTETIPCRCEDGACKR